MTEKRWVVFGAGDMGRYVVYDAIRFYNANVTVVEPVPSVMFRARDCIEHLLPAHKHNKLRLKSGDWRQSIHKILEEADVVVSCAPYAANAELTELAIFAGVPYCDLGGSPDMVEKQRALVQKLHPKKIVVPECGVAPGIANIVAAGLARHGFTKINIRCGGNPLVPPDPNVNRLRYKLVFSPHGLVEEYTGVAMTIRNGKLVPVQARAHVSKFNDEFESAPTSNICHRTVELLKKLGVRDFDYETLRYHGHYGAVGKVNSESELLESLQSNPQLIFDRASDRDRLTLIVSGARETGCEKVQATWELDVPSDPVTKFTAMEIMTGVGITTVAHYLTTEGIGMAGFMLPQEFMSATWVMKEISRRLPKSK